MRMGGKTHVPFGLLPGKCGTAASLNGWEKCLCHRILNPEYSNP